VFFVQKLRDAGFALKQIRALYEARKNGATGHEASRRVLALLEEQKRAVETKIADYQKLEVEISEAMDLVSRCQGCEREPTRETCRKCSVVTSREKLPLPCQAII
ncbi:MAG: MerR family DNA-binding protein, partial [Desulfobacterales bacterium]|nr:MerR family DNA-binding protein [Desulfobacterales bacterium]